MKMDKKTITRLVIGGLAVYGIYYFLFRKKTPKKVSETSKKPTETTEENVAIPTKDIPTKNIEGLDDEGQKIYNNLSTVFDLKSGVDGKIQGGKATLEIDKDALKKKVIKFVKNLPKDSKGFWVKLSSALAEATKMENEGKIQTDEENQRFIFNKMKESGFDNINKIKGAINSMGKKIMFT